MDAQATSTNNDKVEAYCQAWTDSLAELLSQLSSLTWQPEAPSAAADYVPALRVRGAAAPGLAGRPWLSFSARDVSELLGIFLQQEVSVPVESEALQLDPTQKDALDELLRQWSSLTASALETTIGEVSAASCEAESHALASVGKLLRVGDGARSITVLLQPDGELVAALNRPVPGASEPVAPDPSARIEELVRQGNLALLMDVELGVRLRFGCRQAALREVLELATGTVLELDREIEQPVDLLLNGKVIARGEVVVIDGNYGLRVTEVASAEQRVHSL